jgi:alkaline phosphatase
VILFIGDGLGPAHTALAVQYAGRVEGRKLHLESLIAEGNTGYLMPLSYETAVIDSAAAAAEIATGVEVRNETLGVGPSGEILETILEWAEAQGLGTGLVTTMRLSHATPAAFAAHQMSRYGGEAELMTQIVAGHEIEVLLGGGLSGLLPRGKRASDAVPGLPGPLDGASLRDDERDLIAEARSRGYAVGTDRRTLEQLAPSTDRILGVFAANHLPYVIDRRYEKMDQTPSLTELVRAALRVLGKSNQGFFLMVEGGRIDYAGHDNDAGAMLHEVLEFDEALGVAARFQKEHPDTLLLVTADHGTGGFSLTYGQNNAPYELPLPGGTYSPRWFYPGLRELTLIGAQKASFYRIVERAGTDPVKLKDEVLRGVGVELLPADLRSATARNEKGEAETLDFREFYADPDSVPQCLLGRVLSRHTAVVWSTGGHTTEPVMTYGVGPGAGALTGLYHHRHLYRVMRGALEGSRADFASVY